MPSSVTKKNLINPILPNVPFLYPRIPYGFLMFSVKKKKCFRKKKSASGISRLTHLVAMFVFILIIFSILQQTQPKKNEIFHRSFPSTDYSLNNIYKEIFNRKLHVLCNEMLQINK